jgi:hypothetical protein
MTFYRPPVNQFGIEGDDLPYHLRVLGLDPDGFGLHACFYPLVDHYNTHDSAWHDRINAQARAKSTVIFYDLVNTGDYEHTKFMEFVSNYDHPNKVYLTVNQSKNLRLANVKIVPWDFMWNRFKLYYSQSVPWDTRVLHHYAGPDRYQTVELDFDKLRNKKFLSMCGREYGIRKNLFELVSQYEQGYTSNRSRGITVEPEEIRGAFSPVPNRYYLDSYFSIYVESNCIRNDLLHITEKTYEPLLKGHFVLPVSNPGTIKQLKQQGFLFPDFIDYSFDQIEDVWQRFESITQEFKKLLELDLKQLYVDYRQLLLHNQQVFFTTDYDRRIETIYEL